MSVFAPLYAPEEVWREVADLGRVPEQELLRISLAREPSPANLHGFVEREHIERLDRGEQECLQVCKRLRIPILLTDDLAAREAAKALSITPVGSLGIIIRAYRLARISMEAAEELLHRLQDATSLFVTPTIVDLAIDQLRSRK